MRRTNFEIDVCTYAIKYKIDNSCNINYDVMDWMHNYIRKPYLIKTTIPSFLYLLNKS